MIWNQKIFCSGNPTKVELKLSISGQELMSLISFTPISKVDFTVLQKSWWESDTHQQLICGLLDVFSMSSTLDSRCLRAKMKRSRFNALWKSKACLQDLWLSWPQGEKCFSTMTIDPCKIPIQKEESVYQMRKVYLKWWSLRMISSWILLINALSGSLTREWHLSKPFSIPGSKPE